MPASFARPASAIAPPPPSDGPASEEALGAPASEEALGAPASEEALGAPASEEAPGEPASEEASGGPASSMSFVHTPLAQLPSGQEVPSGCSGLEQAPVAWSQVPAAWQLSLAVHAIGSEPTHAPIWQLSICVHESPSVHEAPFGLDA